MTFWQSLNKNVSGNLDQPATGDNNAEFVQVVATPRNVDFWFAGVVGALSTVSVGARAVAGYGASMCQVPPLFVCEPPGGFTAADVGKGMWMKGRNAGNGTAWFGGNFGLLQLPNQSPSAPALIGAMGMVDPELQCYGPETETLPGQHTPIRDGLNVRFDIYDGIARNDPQFQPSRNTVKGLLPGTAGGGSPNKCKLEQSAGPTQGWHVPDDANRWIGPGVTAATAMGLPRDTCAYLAADGGTETCRPVNGGRLGDSVWDIVNYMAIQHSGNALGVAPFFLDIDQYVGADPLRPIGNNDGRTSRWEVYRWELDDPANQAEAADEVEDPNCYTGGFPGSPPAIPLFDRRLLCIAVADCSTLGNGGTQPLTPVDWLTFFLVEPVGMLVGSEAADNKSIYAEFVGDHPDCNGPDSEIAKRVVRLFE